MKNRLAVKIILVSICGWLIIGNYCQAMPVDNPHSNTQPIIILSIDKVESVELFECELSSIRDLLLESACGLMNVRTGSGYSNTESGFLSIGSGNRSVAPPTKGGAFKSDELLAPSKASSFWAWSTGIKIKRSRLVVPEIGWIKSQVEGEDQLVQPGALGEIFRSNGWKTFLIGDQDTIIGASRPGGYTMMDYDGIIDSGFVGAEINGVENTFPYRYRFNPAQVLTEIGKLLKPGNLVLVEYGDFARLDQFREEMLPEQYSRLKQETWECLDYFLGQLIQKFSKDDYRMLVLSPSLSKVGINNRSMLAPVVIRGAGYSKGLLTSGTTNWDGLVANIDLLPTIINMAGLQVNGTFPGRPVRSVNTENPLQKLSKLNYKINKINNSQRSLLDWYLWVISMGWVAATLGIVLKKKLGNGFILFTVVVMPLAILILPLLPIVFWHEGGMLLTSILLVFLFIKLRTTNQRYFLLSAALWGGLILDQITGWNLIRFSALGYSAIGGSRYYGIGNEYMGVFLAVSLVLADLINKFYNRKWPALVILGVSVLVLGWPQLGINFGGTLAAIVGFSFFTLKLYNLDWYNQKVWVIFGGIILTVAIVGWWDSLREPDLQTHLGRFFQLLIDHNLSQTWQIFYRKAMMNLKLLVFSPWTRTILLALGISCFLRFFSKEKMVAFSDRYVWNGILISGLAAFLINDSGVLAFGTCLAYGFTYLLSRFEEREFFSSSKESVVKSQEI